MLYKNEWNHKVWHADVSSIGQGEPAPTSVLSASTFWVRLLSSHIKPKRITFWSMLGMFQLLNIRTFGILFPWTKVLLPYVHATFVNISTICQSECFECIFMIINCFHPILFNFFIDIKKFHMLFLNFDDVFPKKQRISDKIFNLYQVVSCLFFSSFYITPKW
jgi:hypothetical protein